jgi:hypothetical protein
MVPRAEAPGRPGWLFFTLMTDKIKDARHWRDRAAEIRARAGEMQDGVSRRVMLSIAASYELLARRAEDISDRSE